MKTIILFAMVSASNLSTAEAPDDLNISYHSWCENNKVMTENREGLVELVSDCSLVIQGGRCEETVTSMPTRSIINATCRE